MTNEQTKEQFLIALNSNAYIGMCEASDMVNAISALEKQIPKIPILDTIFPSGVKWWRCPICRHNNIETNDRFCHNCGQALDWSDTE